MCAEGPMPDTEALVSLKDVWKVYRIGSVDYPALRGLTLDIFKGEFLAVVGPSGSGKSTLMHIVGGLDKPTRGSVLVGRTKLSDLSGDELAEYRNKQIGFVFQFFNLVQYLTAVENVELPLAISSIDMRVRRAKALELLALFGLKEKAPKRPTELSGGEQQRVAIARSLANDPRLILADEPTGNIDAESAKTVTQAFRKLVDEEGVTVVMVTHNLELIGSCDRVVRLKDGEISMVEQVSR